MTLPVHPPSFNAGVDAALAALRTLRERIVAADVTRRQRALLIETLDALIEHGGELRIEAGVAG